MGMKRRRKPSAGATVDAQAILSRITEFYLSSHDFNGIPAHQLVVENSATLQDLKPVLEELIQAGSISAVFGDVHPNPSIKALPDHHPERQIEILRQTKDPHFCLYPNPPVLQNVVDRAPYADRPFTLMLALGEPQLKPLAFDLAVLEMYRNDPRYTYTTNDVSGTISVRDEHYLGTQMPERDKVLLQDFGFAYDDQMNRAVSVFICYLADLSPEHQRIWHARQLGLGYRLHPDYYRMAIIGEWPERISLFDAFIGELQTINKMADAMGRPSLFRDGFNERPRAFGFLIRPTVNEFNDFVRLLDRMMSDNINRDFFQNEVPYEEDEDRADGKVVVRQKGTIQILADWFAARFRIDDRKLLEDAIAAFKKVRQLRRRPAHAVDEDAFDMTLIRTQRELMIEAYGAVRVIRLCLANHPKARTVEVSGELREGKIWTF